MLIIKMPRSPVNNRLFCVDAMGSLSIYSIADAHLDQPSLQACIPLQSKSGVWFYFNTEFTVENMRVRTA